MDHRSLIPAPCAPCRRQYFGEILPTSAINLHSTRSANERQGEADLIGGATDWLLFINQPTLGKTGGELFEHGNQNSFYSGGLYQFELFRPDTTLFLVITEFGSADFDPATTLAQSVGPCNTGGVPTPAGHTSTQLRTVASVAPVDLIDRVDVVRKSDSAIVRQYTGLIQCHNPDTFRRHYDPM